MHARAGQPAQPEDLIDVDEVVSAYYDLVPDPAVPAQKVVFGTSGHRGSSLDTAFNEAHIVATTAAIVEYRRSQGTDGTLYLGRDTHALSEPAWRTAVVLVPEDEKASLAEELTRQLGRGDRSVQLSLSRALIDLGEFADPVLERAAQSLDPRVAAHARATELLRQDPERGFEEAISEARLMLTPGASSAEESDTGVARAGTEGAEPMGCRR
mgnify:CR=1 FL=1